MKSIDGKMLIIKNFIDEFYNKTVFRSGKISDGDIKPSLIKSLFAFDDPNEEYPIGELARKARVKTSTITDMVDRMERDKFASRVRDEEDRRVVKIKLTEKGKKIRHKFYLKRRDEFRHMFKQLKGKEIDKLIQHLADATEILRKID
ncbi:MarR family winged helix-turn-helix transcriptional regulator [Spirochaetota bacterium]